MRRNFARIAVCAAVLGLLGSDEASAQNAGSANPLPIKTITSLPTLTVAVPYLAMADQLFKKHGLAVENQSAGGSSTLQVDAVLSGNALFGAPGTATALQAIRQGAELKIVAAIANNQIATVINNNTLKKLGVSPDAPIADRFRALKGLTIGTNPEGATYNQMLRAYLRQYGINDQKDVRIVGMGDSNGLISGLEQGRFDAIVSASGVVEQAIGIGAGTMWISGARGDIPGQDATMVCVIIARSDTVEKHPELVKAYLASLQDALEMINNHHDEAGAALKAAYFQKFDPALWQMVWGTAKAAYPTSLAFTKKAFDYWITNDPKGAASFKDVDYAKITYAPAQSP